jgi:HEAT repeat protein
LQGIAPSTKVAVAVCGWIAMVEHKIRRMNWKVGIILVGVGIFIGGCFRPDPPSLTSDSAATKIPAIREAAVKNDRSAIPALISALDDKDPAIRLASIQALEDLTGQTFGYNYYDEEDQRRPAVLQWQQWLKDHPQPSAAGEPDNNAK